jgi:hypothetical protein
MSETQVYWHASPYSNLTSILGNGIQPRFGEVYCSTNLDASARWICFTRQNADKVVLIPFKANPDDMSLGLDHSPMMTKMLGVDDKGASYVYGDTVKPSMIVFDDIRVVDNPFYNKKMVELNNYLERVNDEE